MKATTTPSITIRFSAITFLFALALGFPLGVVVLFIQGRGISLLEIGLLVAIQAATVVVLELPTGGLADVWGRKKVLLLAFAAGVGSTAIHLASFSFASFAAAMLLSGACMALFSGTAEAMFVDALKAVDPDVNLQKSIAAMMSMQGLGMGLGAVAGGFVPRFFAGLPDEGTAILTPLAMPLVMSLAAWLLALLAVAVLVRERPAAERLSPTRQRGPRAIVDVMKQSVVLTFHDRLILVLMSVSAVYALAFAGIEAFWQPHFASLQQTPQIDTRAFGAVYAATFMFKSVGSGLAGVVSGWSGKRYGLVCALSVVLMTAAFVFFWLQVGWIGVLIGFWGIYLLSGLVTAAFQALFNSAIPSDKRATLVSLQALAMRAGVLVGAPAFGWLAERFSIPSAWRCGALVLVFGVPLFLYAERLYSQRGGAAEPAAGEPSPLGSPRSADQGA